MQMFKEKLLTLILLLIHTSCRYCGDGLIPTSPENCTSLSTIAYNCCFIETMALGALPLTLCYPVPIKKAYFPNTMTYTILPTETIIDIACDQPISSAIKYENFCGGIDNPQNGTICQVAGGSDCCLFKYDIFNFCLTKDSYQNSNYTYEYIC